ncbi:hypothetical protein HNY73_021500 [Argiope bruennichi]|uniref:MBD domain-containing protein n=1 Tax=Argiope bruennichi TaxID=94029 RepID=A0A8T0E1E9_ARGBR|nr:hypothetical protein HNY73_021500 [Argiope bruennichi]
MESRRRGSEEKMNSDFLSFVFPKLDDSNYSSWKEDTKVLLMMDRGCWNFAIGEEKPYPEEATEKEKLEYEWRKQRCYTTIYQGVERKLLPLIRHTTKGKKAWNILKDNFAPVSKARLAVLIDEFFELRFNPEQERIVSEDLEQFLVDSASTSQFCYERDWFKNFRELSPTKALVADKRHTCEVKGVVDIDFCIKYVKGNVHITLNDVLYAPKMRRNLISGAKMDLAGLNLIGAMMLCGYDYAWYQLDQTLKDGSYTKLQDDKTCLPENLPLLDISTWERLEKPRKKSKRVDVYYYPPRKERLRSLNDAKRYCEKNNLVFDPDKFNFKPTTVNTRFDQKSDSEEETSIDSNSLDEGNCIDDIVQHEIYMSEIPKTYAETRNSADKSKWDEAMYIHTGSVFLSKKNKHPMTVHPEIQSTSGYKMIIQ